ncbi:MAG: hypothetical protein RR428_03830 [Coprobacillus sp.]
MNERDVQVESRKTFLFILLIFCIIGVLLKSIAYPIGLVMGYIVSYVNFMMTIYSSDLILKSGNNVMIVIVMFIAKMILWIAGFALSIIFKDFINIAGVFIGYLVIQITIYWLTYYTRKEEMK